MQRNRNHVARVLWTPKFKPQCIKMKKIYTRKSKHKKKDYA